jgi:predicted PurR-regulated permease PerM
LSDLPANASVSPARDAAAGPAPAEAAARTGPLALSGLLLIAILTVLHLARDVVVPVVGALILSLVFLPAVRGMKVIGIPAPLGAALVVLGLLAAFVVGVYNLAEPARSWLDYAPKGLREVGVKLQHFTGQVSEVNKATEEMQHLTEDLAGGGDPAAQRKQEVTVEAPSLIGAFLDGARKFSLSAASTLLLLYFLLASGDLFLRKTIAATPRLADKRRAVDIAKQVEAAVSRYLFAVTLINIALGAAVALALSVLGVPNPLLWGVMVALLNFIPYLGEIAIILALTVVGLLTFDDVGHGLLVPGIFLVLSAAERYLITPTIVGRQLSLNPVVIVLSVLFWGAMWGIPGTLLAVPMLVTLKVLCDRIERLKVFGDFLGA